MSQITEQFIRTFEKLKAEINRRAGMPSSHSIEIDRAADRDNTVRRNRALLIYIRDARNLVQHPRHRSDGHAIHISETFLAETQSLLSHLRNPPTASSVGVKRKQMKTAGKTDRLGDLADEMKRCGFSHVPILDEHDVVIGVFNEAAVFSFLWTTEETIVGRQMQISDILSHCRLGTNHAESFKFVSPRTPLDDLVEMFLAIESPTTRVGAAFVTASGKKAEPLNGLITPWDVLATSAK